jgi:hypothetical protein
MTRPEKVKLHCDHCGHDWLPLLVDVLSNPIVIYRDDTKTEQRRVPCPNCGKGVLVDVPKEWLADG